MSVSLQAKNRQNNVMIPAGAGVKEVKLQIVADDGTDAETFAIKYWLTCIPKGT